MKYGDKCKLKQKTSWQPVIIWNEMRTAGRNVSISMAVGGSDQATAFQRAGEIPLFLSSGFYLGPLGYAFAYPACVVPQIFILPQQTPPLYLTLDVSLISALDPDNCPGRVPVPLTPKRNIQSSWMPGKILSHLPASKAVARTTPGLLSPESGKGFANLHKPVCWGT